MILAEGGGAIAVQPQHLGQRCDAVGTHPGVSGKGRGDLHDGPRVIGVMIAAGEQSGARGRAECCRVKHVVAQSVLSDSFQSRHRYTTPKRARVTKTDVVNQDDDDIRRIRGCFHFESRRRGCLARICLAAEDQAGRSAWLAAKGYT